MKHITQNVVNQCYGGVEAWPGNQFPPEYAWCEFGDCRDIMANYHLQSLQQQMKKEGHKCTN